MKTVRFRIGLMCDIDESYDDRLVKEVEVDDEEANDLERLMNKNGEVILMGRFPTTMIYGNHGFLDEP